MRVIRDEKGVSPLIGFILVLMITMLFISTVQTQIAPGIYKKEEKRNIDDIIDEFVSLSGNIISTNLLTVKLVGVDYPKYPFILTPPQAAYSISSRDFDVKLDCDIVLPNGSIIHESMNLTTKRLYVDTNYFFYPNTQIIFENTAVFRKDGNAIITVSDQKMVKNRINIIVLNGSSLSLTSTASADIVFSPKSSGDGVYAENITISFESVNPNYWEGWGADVSGNNVTISVNSAILRILEYDVKAGIGIKAEEEQSPKEPYRIIKLNPFDTYNLTVGESKELGVMVVDYYYNPVPSINVTVNTEVGEGIPSTIETDINGKAYVEFKAKTSGSGNITFSTDWGNESYYVNVYSTSGGGGRGIFDTEWLNKESLDSYYGNVWDWYYGSKKSLTFRVTYANEPIKNAKVNFLVSNESIVELNTSYAITDANGKVSVMASAKMNGTTKIFGTCEGSGDVLNFTVTNVTTMWFYPSWQYRKPINITSSVSATNYQILISNPIYDESNLVLSLHFEENGNYANDYSGLSRHGELVGLSGVNSGNKPQWSNGKFDGGLYFDGGGAVKLDNSIVNGLSRITFAAWIKTTKNGAFALISGANSYRDNEYLLYFSSPTRMYTYIKGSGRYSNLANPINDGEWHFIVWVKDGSSSKVYIDGNLIHSKTQSSSALSISSNGLWLGQEQDSLGDKWDSSQSFVGYMDEVKIYSRALSESEIKAMYEAKVKHNYNDVRFTCLASSESKISYWMEADGKFWIKVPELSSDTRCYIYYGNPSASSESTSDVFVYFFDDFDEWKGWSKYGSGNVDQYRYSGDQVLRKKDYCDPYGGYKLIGTTISNFRLIVKERRDAEGSVCGWDRYGLEDGNWDGYNVRRQAYVSSTGQFGYEKRDNAKSVSYKTISMTQPYKNWYITELKRYGSSLSAVLYKGNREKVGSVSGSDSSFSSFDRIVIRGGRPYYMEWIAVANYVSPEPSYTIGSEEVQE